MLTDITTPVKVNVTTATSFSIENYLRKNVLVSAGETKDSKLSIGACVVLTDSNYEEYLVEGSRSLIHARSFFSYAGNKPLILLEVGGDTTISEQCAALKNFIDLEVEKAFGFIVPSTWFAPKDSALTEVFGIQAPQQAYSIKNLVPQKTEITKPNDEGKILEVKINFTSDFDRVEASIEYNESETNKDLVFDVESKKLTLPKDKVLPTNSATLILKGVKDTPSAESSIRIALKVEDLVDEDTTPVMNTATIQTPIAKDLGFQKLATNFSKETDAILFHVESSYPETTDVLEAEAYYKGLKSVHIVSNSIENTNLSLVGVVVGKEASSYFDLSSDNPSSPLNFKTISGVTPIPIPLPAKKLLIQNGITFADEMAGQVVIMNGRQMDGKPWEYYYNYYHIEFELKKKLSLLILNGVNNPVSALKYDQDGIDTIKANILSVLESEVALGTLTAYGKSWDSNTNSFVGQSEVTAPEFYSYIAANPENYANEIIGGFKMYLQIGKFVKQIEINVTKSA